MARSPVKVRISPVPLSNTLRFARSPPLSLPVHRSHTAETETRMWFCIKALVCYRYWLKIDDARRGIGITFVLSLVKQRTEEARAGLGDLPT